MIKQIYYYTLSLITLVMVIFGGIFAFINIADLISPTGYYQSYEDFKYMKEEDRKYTAEANNKEPEVLSEDELRSQYEDTIKHEKEVQKQNALNGLIKSFGWMIIPFPIFLYMQRQVRRIKLEQ